MADPITLALSQELATKVGEIANRTNQSMEQVVLAYLETMATSLPALQPDVQLELKALSSLSDDTLWTIVLNNYLTMFNRALTS